MSTNNGYLMESSTISSSNTNPTYFNESYTGFTFNGNCIIDTIAIRNYEMTDDEILNTSVSKMPADWTPDVLFLANMNHTVDGSNVFGLVSTPTKWSLYRQEVDGDIMYKVCDVTPDITSWIDYKAEGKKTYQYYLFGETDTQISEPIVTDKINTDFFGYYLISSDADSSDPSTNDAVQLFEFDLNVTSDKVVTNNSATYLQNYTKYDSVVILNRNFKSGSFSSVLIPKIANEYDFDAKIRWADYQESLRNFIMSKDYKYLKNRNGELIKVITANTSSSAMDYQLNEEANSQGQELITVTIYWTEIGDAYSTDGVNG